MVPRTTHVDVIVRGSHLEVRSGHTSVGFLLQTVRMLKDQRVVHDILVTVPSFPLHEVDEKFNSTFN